MHVYLCSDLSDQGLIVFYLAIVQLNDAIAHMKVMIIMANHNDRLPPTSSPALRVRLIGPTEKWLLASSVG